MNSLLIQMFLDNLCTFTIPEAPAILNENKSLIGHGRTTFYFNVSLPKSWTSSSLHKYFFNLTIVDVGRSNTFRTIIDASLFNELYLN